MASGDRADKNRKLKKSAGSAEKLSQKEQSERFIKAARELGVDETGEEFERAIEGILRKQRTKK